MSNNTNSWLQLSQQAKLTQHSNFNYLFHCKNSYYDRVDNRRKYNCKVNDK